MTADDVVDRVLDAVGDLGPTIAGGLATHRSAAVEEDHPTGDEAIEADVWADDRIVERLRSVEGVGEIASEEREDVLDAGGDVAVTIDPLDGSSNVATNNLCGTIVGVYDGDLPAGGADVLAAAYVLYGPITTMVVAVEGTVTELVLDDRGAKRLARDVTLPDEPVVYGFGGRDPDWTDAFAEFAGEIRQELKLRYGGAMVGDVNQVVHHGGLFAYPALRDRPEGKLRLQFEAIPMAYVIESAGGGSSNGTDSLLAVEPAGLHDRTPVYLGNEPLVDRLEAALGSP